MMLDMNKRHPTFRLRAFRQALPTFTLLVLGAVLANGCLSKPPLVRQDFAFPLPPSNAKQVQQGKDVLEIRELDVAAPFDSQSFLYRTGFGSYERDPYAEFLVPPSEALLQPLIGLLQSQGCFEDVIASTSLLRPDRYLAVRVTELCGDFRNRSSPAALMRIRFELLGSRNGQPGKLLLQKDYEEHVPLRARTAAALMAGWDQALNRITREFGSDLHLVKRS